MSDVANVSVNAVNELIAKKIEELRERWDRSRCPDSASPWVDRALETAAHLARDTPVARWVAMEDESPAPDSWVVAMVREPFSNPRATVIKTNHEGGILWFDNHGYPVDPTHWHYISEPTK